MIYYGKSNINNIKLLYIESTKIVNASLSRTINHIDEMKKKLRKMSGHII